MEDFMLVLFCLSIAFPVIHSIHCLPWFRKRDKKVKHNVEQEKGISILIPCYNEQGMIQTSIENMKSLSYSESEIIYINDGSTDHTLSLFNKLLKLTPSSKAPLGKLTHKKVKTVYQSELYPHIYVLDKVNGGKADSLNAGIEFASHDLVVTLDADTILADGALSAVNGTFEDQEVVAAGGMVHVLQTKASSPLTGLSLLKANMLIRAQSLDFLRAFYILKVSLARFRSLAIISGAFGIFRKQTLLDVGGYRITLGEDIDITLQIHRYLSKHKNQKIVFIPEAVSYTELPETWKDLFKQRIRWQKAFIDCLIHYRSFFWKNLFARSVSFFYIFESFLAGTLAVYPMTGVFVVDGIINYSSFVHYFLLYLLFIFVLGLAYDMVAIGMGEYYGFAYQDNDFYRLLVTILFDIFVYRFVIIFCVLYGSIAYFFDNKSWNKVSRTGRNYQTDSQSAA
ncbi:glycosyltransferase [Fictibacillus sp. Mic-4]|uniref:glycosyltransferase family 2 protein n=1 Tax=Fictibacillus sp. Mic-4 TaxID=3132826 RepID=UPI003CEA41AB